MPSRNFLRRQPRPKPTPTSTPAAEVHSKSTTTEGRKLHSTTSSRSKTSETTKPNPKTFLRLSTRKPFLRLTSMRTTEHMTKTSDQTLESSNQQSLEREFHDDTTKLGDLATVLSELQKASVSIRNSSRSLRTPPNRARKLISTTFAPVAATTPPPQPSVYPTKFVVRQQQPRPFEKVVQKTPQAGETYDYYDDEDAAVVGQLPQQSKVLLHSSGLIQCLDQGNFPHPASCKKFIYCAKIDNGDIVGWEYTCPKNLSFDPIGGICNWAAGLGCGE